MVAEREGFALGDVWRRLRRETEQEPRPVGETPLLNAKKELSEIAKLLLVAEREGFEPPVPLSTAVFKTAVIDHSTISPCG